MFRMIQTIQKMRASLTVLVEHQPRHVMTKIHNIYLKNARLYTDDEEEKEIINQQTEFQKFLERDEKITLYKSKKHDGNCDHSKVLT